MSRALPLPDPSYVSSRSVGDATVTVVSDGALLWAPRFPVPEAEWRRAMPEADPDGRAWFGLNVVLVRLGAARIVVDPALDDPGTAFERWFVGGSSLGIERSPGLAAALGALGWMPEEVTHVVVTHPHGDHYGGVMAERDGGLALRFPNARHFVGRADWEGNPERTRTGSELARRLGAVERRGLLELVDGEQEIAPGVTLLPTPGETPGHLVVRVRSTGEDLYVLGDLVHHACEVEHPGWAPPHADAATLAATRARLFPVLARTGALAVAAHEPFPPWRRIVAVADGFRWEPA
jgi:glyoxylase-like metal-dependent hydrolase (beta-lactamase superfamily II)